MCMCLCVCMWETEREKKLEKARYYKSWDNLKESFLSLHRMGSSMKLRSQA